VEETVVRGKLHLNNVKQFAEFLTGKGWVEEVTRGEYEILRMRHPDEREPLILYARMRSEHATLPDNQHMFNHLVYEYLAEKRSRIDETWESMLAVITAARELCGTADVWTVDTRKLEALRKSLGEYDAYRSAREQRRIVPSEA